LQTNLYEELEFIYMCLNAGSDVQVARKSSLNPLMAFVKALKPVNVIDGGFVGLARTLRI
jgi:hypothetical protein